MSQFWPDVNTNLLLFLFSFSVCCFFQRLRLGRAALAPPPKPLVDPSLLHHPSQLHMWFKKKVPSEATNSTRQCVSQQREKRGNGRSLGLLAVTQPHLLLTRPELSYSPFLSATFRSPFLAHFSHTTSNEIVVLLHFSNQFHPQPIIKKLKVESNTTSENFP